MGNSTGSLPRVNPFREMIVATPWENAPADVATIHASVFDECLRGLAQVRQTGRSASLLIHGEAGAGKTHLLRRLRAQLAPQAPSSTYRQENLFVWVRLQTSPRMIWRTVRRTLVDDWFRPVANHRSQFERILFHRFAEKRPAEGDLERWYEYMLEEVPDGLKDLIDEIATDLDLDRNTAVAFEHIAFRRHLRDLRAWLGGASLPEAALERMDLALDEGTDEEREDQSKYVVRMLCRLAGVGLPIVLCFDQVEALQLGADDKDGLFAFGQLTSTIHDGTNNVLIVSCMLSSFFDDMKKRSFESDYDRMTSLGAVSLDPLKLEEAKQVIRARLDASGTDFPAHESLPEFWPFQESEFRSIFGGNTTTPRRLLSRCAEKYDAIQAGTKPPVANPVATFLSERWSTLVERKLVENTPDKSEEILRHALPLFVALQSPDCGVVRDELLPDVSLIFQRSDERTGLSVCTQSNMNSLANRFKRLKPQLAAQRLRRLLIVRDDRSPISKGAKAAKKHLEELQQHGAVVVHPSKEVLAALDALRELLSDAKSGDLASAGDTISPRTVEEWLINNLPGSIRDFVDELFGRADGREAIPNDAADIEALSTLLDRENVVKIQTAAEALGRPIEYLVGVVNRHPDHFALLGDPPEILLRVVDEGEPAVALDAED